MNQWAEVNRIFVNGRRRFDLVVFLVKIGIKSADEWKP
jgi:hypothetical protein